jgi:adenosine deaminase
MLDIAQSLGWVSLNLESTEINKFRDQYLITKPFKDLTEVLKKFSFAQKLLNSEAVLERLAFECVEDMFNDGIRVADLRYSPNFIQGANAALSFEQIHLALCRGLEKGIKLYPMAIGLIVIIQRTLDIPSAEKVLDFVISKPKYVYGIDMADDETRDARPFLPLFQEAKKQGFKITMHAGEIPSKTSIDNIVLAVNEFGADRIGHGVQAIHSNKVCQMLVEKKIPLELCPTSNVLTQAVQDINHHPLKKLYDCGVLTTVSTDDPGIFDLDLTSEYKKLHAVHGITERDLACMNKLAFAASFIPNSIKDEYKNLL